MSLAVGEQSGNGQPDIVLSSAASDQLTVQSSGSARHSARGEMTGSGPPDRWRSPISTATASPT